MLLMEIGFSSTKLAIRLRKTYLPSHSYTLGRTCNAKASCMAMSRWDYQLESWRLRQSQKSGWLRPEPRRFKCP